MTSSRDTMTDDDSGIDLAAAMTSSSWWRIDSMPTSSTGCSSSTSRNWSLIGPPALALLLLVLGPQGSATTWGTKAETSPPKRATSRTSLEATKEYFELVGMKIVSTPERWLFIWAICISVSKSDTARSPRTMAEAPTSRAT